MHGELYDNGNRSNKKEAKFRNIGKSAHDFSYSISITYISTDTRATEHGLKIDKSIVQSDTDVKHLLKNNEQAKRYTKTLSARNDFFSHALDFFATS